MEPQKIGRYEIKAEIGRGGMATVYQAYDPRFEREVAIKVLPREMLHDPQFRIRFEREAKTIAMLEHPSIVPVYDFGEEDGQPYFVMRYMTGGSLSDRIKKGPLPIPEAARIFERLAPAMDEAHAKGIIHRDLKPGNILFDQYNEPYVSDFGIAKLTESQSNVTGSAIVGTPAYMSPEQGQGEGIDGRSDIYGLGVILFEMLTACQPYSGDTPMSVVVKHITEPVPHILDVKPDLPPEIEAVIEKAMAKNRDERFPTVQALADALSAVARGETPDLEAAASQTITSTKTRVAVPKTKIAKRVAGAGGPGAGKGGGPVAAPQGAAPHKMTAVWIGLGVVLLLVVVAAAAGLFIFRDQISFLAAPTRTQVPPPPSPTVQSLPSATQPLPPPPRPTDTPVPPTVTPTVGPPPTLAPTPMPVIGGADLIAFLNGNNVWLMGVDGANLRPLTNDGTVKHNLEWMPDGQNLVYISDKCIQTVNIATMEPPKMISCFPAANFLESFQISPDGKQVAISLNRELYVVPFDLPAISQARAWTQLAAMQGCFTYTPATPQSGEASKSVRWSSDSKRIAVAILGVDAGRQVDLIRVIDISTCRIPTAHVLDTFPGARFKMTGYNDQPVIPSFDWNGETLFLLNSLIRNQSYGYPYVYNLETYKADLLNPLGGTGCCYTDMHWSPDGTYVIFGYQNYDLGPAAKTQLYYIPYGTISAGGIHMPLPLPPDFFSNPRDHPDAVLRPAR